jgi:hypothetical protein
MSGKRILGWSCLLAVVVPFGFFARACFFVGPALEVTRSGETVHVAGRFLGEYSLGFERVQVREAGSDRIICDFVGRSNADVDLRPGRNPPVSLFGADARMVPRRGAPPECRLERGSRYQVRAWGNNGSGRVRPSSVVVRL